MSQKHSVQLSLPEPATHGGRRRGAGRKPNNPRRVSHLSRPDHKSRHPVHVTLRLRSDLPSLRRRNLFPGLREAISRATHEGFSITHFSVQTNHIHLIVEATSRRSLSTGIQGLVIRAARSINRALSRTGSVWADRYHARALCTPREVRNAIAYVLLNHTKHQTGPGGIDPCSSGAWFDGWRDRSPTAAAPAPVAGSTTWLGSIGWRRHGLIDPSQRPRS